MCERWLLKKNAKESLRNFFWSAVLVLVIQWVINNIIGLYSGSSWITQIMGYINNTNAYAGQVSYPFLSSRYFIGIILTVLIGSPITVGAIHFFQKNRKEKAEISEIFFTFKNGTFLNVAVTLLLEGIYIALWAILFIIPGIVKSYEYYFIPYIMAENPDIDRREAFAMSKRMTNGFKWDVFVFELSFILWDLLVVVTFGIAIIYVAPYKQAATVELYECLKANYHKYENENPNYYQTNSY